MSSSLTLDWLKPVVGISYCLRRRNSGPACTSLLASQVQLAMHPYTAYVKILETREGQSLLHVAAEMGNEMAVHLLLLLGAMNSQDNTKRLPYQCAHENGYHDLAMFIKKYSEINCGKDVSTKHVQRCLQKEILMCIEDYRAIGVGIQIYSDIPEVDEVINNLKGLKSASSQANNKTGTKKQSEVSSDNFPPAALSNIQKTILRMNEEEKLKNLVDSTVDKRFPETKKVFSDGSVAKKLDYSGSSYFDEDSNLGFGFPIHPAIDIHSAEQIAVKIALEQVASENDAVVLTDRQPMLNVMNAICKEFRQVMNIQIMKSTDMSKVLLNLIILFRLKYPPNPYMKYGLHWIPSHKGLEGNDVADVLAKKAMKEGRMVLCGEIEDEVKKKREAKKDMEERLKMKVESK